MNPSLSHPFRLPLSIISAALLAATLLVGCQSTTDTATSSHLMVTTAAEAESGTWAKPHETLSLRTQPVARVIDCEGKNVSVEVVDATGSIVGSGSAEFPQPHMATKQVERTRIDARHDIRPMPVTLRGMQKSMLVLPLSKLLPGTYTARLFINGVPTETTAFTLTH